MFIFRFAISGRRLAYSTTAPSVESKLGVITGEFQTLQVKSVPANSTVELPSRTGQAVSNDNHIAKLRSLKGRAGGETDEI